MKTNHLATIAVAIITVSTLGVNRSFAAPNANANANANSAAAQAAAAQAAAAQAAAAQAAAAQAAAAQAAAAQAAAAQAAAAQAAAAQAAAAQAAADKAAADQAAAAKAAADQAAAAQAAAAAKAAADAAAAQAAAQQTAANQAAADKAKADKAKADKDAADQAAAAQAAAAQAAAAKAAADQAAAQAAADQAAAAQAAAAKTAADQASAAAAAASAAAASNSNGNSSAKTNASVTMTTVPLGLMSAYPTVVQTGTNPTLTWSIMYPSVVSDVATISPPGSITLNTAMYVSVRPIGTGVTGGNTGVASNSIPAEARMSINGGSYAQLFYGTSANVDPAYSLYIKKLKKGDTIDFGGDFVKNNATTPFYTSKSHNFQVISLVDGDSVPTSFNLKQSSKLASYLSPYLDASGKVKVGPLSVLVMMELAETSKSNANFDYQDMVLLVTFGTGHPNNGHGNNLDGVDSSNPGQGHGGPNGAVDLSAGVDDEAKK